MLVKMVFNDRTGQEVTTLEFEHDAVENYIQMIDCTGSSFCVLDPLTDLIKVTLPTISPVTVPNPPDPEPPPLEELEARTINA